MKEPTVFGIVYYTPDEWRRVRDASTDLERWEDTYEEWLEAAEKQERMLAGMGHRVYRVDVTARELMDWCAKEQRPLDASARAAFAVNRVRLAGESGSLKTSDG